MALDDAVAVHLLEPVKVEMCVCNYFVHSFNLHINFLVIWPLPSIR